MLYRIHCVKCGAVIDFQPTPEAAYSRPPACGDCFDDIDTEAEKRISMWPHDWYGHCRFVSHNRGGAWVATGSGKEQVNADLIDAILAPGGVVGRKTPDWPYPLDFAEKRMRLGASLTILRNAQGELVRYTIHHIGEPFKLTIDQGNTLIDRLPLKLCWRAESLGALHLEGGTLHLYQFDKEKSHEVPTL